MTHVDNLSHLFLGQLLKQNEKVNKDNPEVQRFEKIMT